MRTVLVPGLLKRHGPAVRLWGLAVILGYWSSVIWLPYVLRPLGLPGGSPLLTRFLELYYWLPLSVLGGLTRVLPYPAFMFYGPFLAAVLPAAVSSLVWWAALTSYLRRGSSPASA